MEIVRAYEDGCRDAVLEEAIGTGKSTTCACLMAYFLHRLLCVRDPQTHFHVAPGDYLTIINMARSAAQAKNIVFSKLRNRVKRSPWFRSRGYLPDPKINSELRFPKEIVCLPGNSKETVALGYDIIYAILDEANRFEDKQEHDNAKEVFDELQRRITSRFDEFGEGMVISISSTTHDLCFTRTKEGEEGVDYRRRTILDLWPESKLGKLVEAEYQGHRYMVPDARSYRVQLIKNPAKFFRDYYCVAASGEHPYMPSYEWLLDHASGVTPWSDDLLQVASAFQPQRVRVLRVLAGGATNQKSPRPSPPRSPPRPLLRRLRGRTGKDRVILAEAFYPVREEYLKKD